MRPSQILHVLEREFLAAADGGHTPVMLWGPPGVGKSQLVAQVAHRYDAPLVDIRLAQMEPTDLRGIPFREGATVVWSVPELLPDRVRHGARGILFLDEITSAPPTVTAAAYQLILDRRLGEYRVPDGWVIFAASNRHGDRGVTYQMAAPLANRFTHYEVEPELEDWIAWAHRRGIDPRLIAFLRFRPDLLFDFQPSRAGHAFPSPRSWEFAHEALAKFAGDDELLSEALAGCVGPAAALACQAFIDHVDALPDVASIAAGRCLDVPGPIDLQYAVASSLVRHVSRLESGERTAAIGHVLRYARGFPHRELGVMLVIDLQRAVGTPLLEHPEFKEWAQRAGSLLSYERE